MCKSKGSFTYKTDGEPRAVPEVSRGKRELADFRHEQLVGKVAWVFFGDALNFEIPRLVQLVFLLQGKPA